MATSALPSMKTIFTLLREINLEQIRQSSNEPFEIVLTGEKAHHVAGMLQSNRVRVGSDVHHAGLKVSVVRSQTNKTFVQEETLVVSAMGESAFLPTSVNHFVLSNWSEQSLKNELLPLLLDRMPENLQLGMARYIPLAREYYSKQLIDETAKANALYAASTAFAGVLPLLNVPLNVADMLVLTKNQLVMAYKMALASGKTGAPNSVMTELIGVLGSAFLMRQAARSLVGLIPGWGAIPKVAVAFAGTQLVGKGVNVWLTDGQRFTERELKKVYTEALERGKKVIKPKMQEGARRKKEE
jgi:uncharacterized protein (DUF697 family)